MGQTDHHRRSNLGYYGRLVFILGRYVNGARLALRALEPARASAELPLRAERSFLMRTPSPPQSRVAN